jgi:hypothetical protein
MYLCDYNNPTQSRDALSGQDRTLGERAKAESVASSGGRTRPDRCWLGLGALKSQETKAFEVERRQPSLPKRMRVFSFDQPFALAVA